MGKWALLKGALLASSPGTVDNSASIHRHDGFELFARYETKIEEFISESNEHECCRKRTVWQWKMDVTREAPIVQIRRRCERWFLSIDCAEFQARFYQHS